MNRLTETEILTLKHILGFNNHAIARFESLNLDDNARQFIIFDMMMKLQEREQKQNPQPVKRKPFFWF